MIAAAKSWMTETPSTGPMTTSMTLGGIRIPRGPPAAITPPERLASYPPPPPAAARRRGGGHGRPACPPPAPPPRRELGVVPRLDHYRCGHEAHHRDRGADDARGRGEDGGGQEHAQIQRPAHGGRD